MLHRSLSRLALLGALLVAATIVACGGTPTWQQKTSTNAIRRNVMIQFTDATLHPTTAQITADGNVVWVNYTSGKVGVVRFDASVRDAFPCEMRPLFSEVAGSWQSTGITGDSENVTLPCTPKPGEYEYELQLVDAMAGSPLGEDGDVLSVMRGKIRVGP